jgi:hypothetical protein
MSKSIIFILSSDDNYAYNAANIPTLLNGDTTLIVRPSADPDVAPLIVFHEHGAAAALNYTAKQRARTIYSTGALPTKDNALKFETNAVNLIVWNTEIEGDTAEIIQKAHDLIVHLVNDASVNINNTDAILKVFMEGGTYTGVDVDVAGVVSTLGEQTYVLEPDVWVSVRRSTIISLIKSIIPDIKYEGFNPYVIRRAFIAKHNNDEGAIRDLLMVFAAYSHIGNRLTKLTVRRVDLVTGKKLMEAVESMGIKKVDRTINGLTLPRLAISFMPEYLMFRKYFAGELQSQTSSTMAVVYKDICFHGCPAIKNMSGFGEFHIEFSSYIYDSKNETAIDDKTFLKKYKSWNKVSTDGYASDTMIHGRMTTAIASSGLTVRQAYAFMIDGVKNVYDVEI